MKADKALLEQEVIAALRQHDGGLWREVQGELQESYDEFALWVLLFEDSDPQESHRGFCNIVAPFMTQLEPAQFTVSYTVLTDIFDISVDTLMSNDEIKAAVSSPTFAKTVMTRARGPLSPFTSKLSGNRP